MILIGGASCTGKTLLSQRLMERLLIPYLSIDHVKMGLVKGWENCGFTPEDGTEHIGRILWPVLRGIVTTAIENSQHLILEGCYLLPELVLGLEREYLEEILYVTTLGFSEDYILRHYQDGILPHRGVIEARELEKRSVKAFLEEHRERKERCLACGGEYLEIREDYERELGQIREDLVRRAREME